jgi:hypothetical protein
MGGGWSLLRGAGARTNPARELSNLSRLLESAQADHLLCSGDYAGFLRKCREWPVGWIDLRRPFLKLTEGCALRTAVRAPPDKFLPVLECVHAGGGITAEALITSQSSGDELSALQIALRDLPDDHWQVFDRLLLLAVLDWDRPHNAERRNILLHGLFVIADVKGHEGHARIDARLATFVPRTHALDIVDLNGWTIPTAALYNGRAITLNQLMKRLPWVPLAPELLSGPGPSSQSAFCQDRGQVAAAASLPAFSFDQAVAMAVAHREHLGGGKFLLQAGRDAFAARVLAAGRQWMSDHFPSDFLPPLRHILSSCLTSADLVALTIAFLFPTLAGTLGGPEERPALGLAFSSPTFLPE